MTARPTNHSRRTVPTSTSSSRNNTCEINASLTCPTEVQVVGTFPVPFTEKVVGTFHVPFSEFLGESRSRGRHTECACDFCRTRLPCVAATTQRLNLGETNVKVLSREDGSAPAGTIVAGSNTAVGSSTLQGWTVMSKLTPFPVTLVTITPAKPTML